ncbi:MAG: C10 family peptidase [Bacteroidales bacterium]|nr:C10 family peptidase [Bacteroidales bacterium]
MRRHLLLLAALTATTLGVGAKPIDPTTAQKVASNFIQTRYESGSLPQIVLAETRIINDEACLYIFNINDEGFIVISADDRAVPILGYSFEGVYDKATVAPAADFWFNGYAKDIATLKQTDADACADWNSLLTDSDPTLRWKADTYLLTSKWGQGTGYNMYCPVYNNQNAVVGCVATAMAQIIRYHRYPVHGFDSTLYHHTYYGTLSANFYNSTYTYTRMPDRVYTSSSMQEKEAASLLSYHCGIATRMNYQWPGHTDGSGTQSEYVPNGLKYFGYMRAKISNMGASPSEAWYEMLRNEIDNERPVYYSGTNSDGGHAFVVDGYNTTGNRFHFNWGWSGSSDGFYTLTATNGYQTMLYAVGQTAVYNIIPSKISSHFSDKIYVDAESNGDGTSWQSCTNNLTDALTFAGSRHLPIWMKGGTYYAAEGQDVVMTVPAGVSVYGGFAGTESSLSERISGANPTIIDGNNQKQLIITVGDTSKISNIDEITFTHAPNMDAGIGSMGRNTIITHLHFNDNYAPGHALLQMNRTTMTNCSASGNNAASVVQIVRGRINSCLFSNNIGAAIEATAAGVLINNTIVGQGSYGVHLMTNVCSMLNCVVWGYDEGLLSDDATSQQVTYCALPNSVLGEGNIHLATTNANNDSLYGPMFVDPDNADYHIAQRSILINRGKPGRTNLSDYDYDGNERVQRERVDIGCYESEYLKIDRVAEQLLTISPNPTTDLVDIRGITPQTLVQLLAMNGTVISQTMSVDGTASFSLKELPNGAYIVRTANTSSKIIKQ